MVRHGLLLLSAVFVASFAGCAGCSAPATECTSDLECANHPLGKTRCEPMTWTCVDCFGDAQCPSGLCLPDNTCAQCTGDANCPSGTFCGSNNTCVAGCSSDAPSCPAGETCLAGECVDCVADADCGPGRVCSTNECVPGCSQNQPNCPDGLVCELASGTCVVCLDDSNCVGNPAGPACNPVTHTCVPCTENADCTDPTKPICDPAQNTCVECLGDAQCAPGSVCSGSVCVPGCNANQPCPSGQQCNTTTGVCVECVDDSACGGATPRCLVPENRCVECLPGPGDTCPAGEYCRADFVCERGCKSGSDCASGQCVNNSCVGCTGDDECMAGNVCESGSCIPACDVENLCGTGRTCCSGHCVDTSTQLNNCGACGIACGANQTCCGGACTTLNTPTHCGACGITCGAGQTCCNGACTQLGTLANCGACGQACAPGEFCDGNSCHAPTYPNFCNNNQVYVIYDGVPIDDAAANVMASTITANCPPTVSVTYGQQTNPALVNQTTGEPLTGPGSTVVLAGGPWPNKPVKWLELTKKTTRVYYTQDGVTHYFRRRADASVVTQITAATCSPQLDHFLVELVTDPANGTLALIGYGACPGGYGTQAAGYYYANVMLPNRASYPNSWYIVKWQDGNADSLPNASDTFTILATGN